MYTIHTHTYIYTHMYIQTYKHTYTHTHTHTHIDTHTHKYGCALTGHREHSLASLCHVR